MAAITDLAAASSVAAADLLVVSQSGTDRKVTADKFGVLGNVGTWAALQTFSGQIKTPRVQGSATITLAANEARYVSDWVSGTFGLLVVFDASNGYVGVFMLRGGAGTVVEALDPSNRFSHTSGTATSINCYYNAGQYWIENKLAGSAQVSVLMLG